jgi:hypothetical protein
VFSVSELCAVPELRGAIENACGGAVNGRRLGRLFARVEEQDHGGLAVARCGEDANAGGCYILKTNRGGPCKSTTARRSVLRELLGRPVQQLDVGIRELDHFAIQL